MPHRRGFCLVDRVLSMCLAGYSLVVFGMYALYYTLPWFQVVMYSGILYWHTRHNDFAEVIRISAGASSYDQHVLKAAHHTESKDFAGKQYLAFDGALQLFNDRNIRFKSLVSRHLHNVIAANIEDYKELTDQLIEHRDAHRDYEYCLTLENSMNLALMGSYWNIWAFISFLWELYPLSGRTGMKVFITIAARFWPVSWIEWVANVTAEIGCVIGTEALINMLDLCEVSKDGELVSSNQTGIPVFLSGGILHDTRHVNLFGNGAAFCPGRNFCKQFFFAQERYKTMNMPKPTYSQ
jgi:hypothetical protein